jgi:Type III flagellar switch regulator (C-ring) FliN C-term
MTTPPQIPQFPVEPNQPATEIAPVSGGQVLTVTQPDRWNLGPGFEPLTVELDVSVPVRDFRVRNLLALESGQVIETQWGHGEDVPLASCRVPLAWSEFEVTDSLLGVRVTRLT